MQTWISASLDTVNKYLPEDAPKFTSLDDITMDDIPAIEDALARRVAGAAPPKAAGVSGTDIDASNLANDVINTVPEPFRPIENGAWIEITTGVLPKDTGVIEYTDEFLRIP